MKVWILFIVVNIGFIIPSYSQQFAIAADKMNNLYVGIENPLSIAVENTSFDSLIVKATEGQVRMSSHGKYFYYIDRLVGPVDIIIYRKLNNNLFELGRSQFVVKRVGLPEFRFGRIGGYAYVEDLLKIDSALAKWHHLNDFIPIEKFSVEVISSDAARNVKNINLGSKISKETKNLFRLLKPGDTLYISEVYITLLGEKNVYLEGFKNIIIK